MRRLALLVCLSLCACDTITSTEPRVITQTVEVPVATPCKPDVGPDPAYPDSDAALTAASDIFEKAKLVMAGRLMRIQRESEYKAALAACAGS